MTKVPLSNYLPNIAVLVGCVLFPFGAVMAQDLHEQYHRMMLAAIVNNQIEEVKTLLKSQYVKINDPAYASSYLAEAAVYDRPEIAQVLLKAGADIKWHNSDNVNLVHAVAQNVRTSSLLSILISALAKATGGVGSAGFKSFINMPTISLRQTPLQLAILNHMALQYQDAVLFVTKQLIEAGADPNVRDHDNTTALWLANHGHLPLVATYLKEHGAHE